MCNCNVTMGHVNVLPVAVPGEVPKSTETVCVVGVSFTIRNLTTAPFASVTVYTMGSNCTTTAVRMQEQYTSSYHGIIPHTSKNVQ